MEIVKLFRQSWVNTMKKKLKALLAILFFSLASLNATYPKVALVLSGGGAKGFAQIAVVEKIRELGIPIDFICGTSMGGLIGGYYALGYSSSDIKEMITEKPLLDYLIYNPTTTSYAPSLFKDPDGLKLSVGLTKNGIGSYPGLLQDQGILSYLNRTTIKSPGEVDFDELPIPFKAVSIDVSTGNEVILDHGYISDAMRATMSLPIIFPPYLLKDGTYCMDGGLVDNLPVQVAKDWGADIIISVDVSSESLKSSKDFSTLSGIIIQTINLTTFGNREESQKLSDIVVLPKVSDYMVLDVGKFEEILEKGYEAFELNKDYFLELRDEISKYRDLEFVEEKEDSTYSEIPDPLVTSIKIVDVSNNNSSYSYLNRFDKYINVRLTDTVLEEVEKDVQDFATLNNISSVTFNFNPTDKENNSGVLELGLRKWENAPSKIDLLGLARLGFSTNSNNMSWLYFSFDMHSQLKEMLADKMSVDLKLNISESTKLKAKVGYQFFSDRDEELTLFLQFGGNFGSLSPANNKHFKYYIPSFSIGLDVGLGLDFRLSSKLSSELLLNYSLVSLSSSTLPSGIGLIEFENPILNIFNADLSVSYLNMADSIFSIKGYGIDGFASLRSADLELGTIFYVEASYNLPLTQKDTIKTQGSFGYSTANYQLTSSYFDVGGYRKIPGSYFGQLTREYFLLNLSYQRYLGEFLAPIYFQAGLKFFGYDSYNPMDNIYPTDGSYMIVSPDFNPSLDNLGLGLYSGIGYKTTFGDLVFGGGFTINGNFCLVLEFV